MSCHGSGHLRSSQLWVEVMEIVDGIGGKCGVAEVDDGGRC